MQPTIYTFLIVCPLVFLAGFVDAVAGGGGLISLPALLALDIPPQLALGTNKLASSVGAVVSSWTFWKAGRVEKKLILRVFPVSVVSSVAGASAVSFIPPGALQPVVLTLLIGIMILVFRKKDWGSVSTYNKEEKSNLPKVCTFASVIAFGDGFMGPGTGTFLLFCFLSLGFDFVTAAGNSRVLNMASNLGALSTFLLFGHVLFVYGLMMALGMALGGYTGSRTAISKGNAFVRILFKGITVILVLKIAVTWGIKWMN